MLENLPHSVGKLLKNIRPGLEKIVYYDSSFNEVPETIYITSPAFSDGGLIPIEFTADGQKVSPPLQWEGIPNEAKSLILIVEDADSPTPYPLTHAIVWDLPAGNCKLAQGGISESESIKKTLGMGINSFLQNDYLPPDPPPEHGPHRYVFQLFALNQPLEFSTAPSKDNVKKAMQDFVIAKGHLIGIYERHKDNHSKNRVHRFE
jgi:Raf kinase inhibitor-like YbhB/YbcL family protein